MRFPIFIILFVMFALMFGSQLMYESNLEDGTEFNIYNFTENYMNWEYNYTENVKDDLFNITSLDKLEITSIRANNIIHKTIDFAGYTLFEISKFSIEFGYTHPEYNFEYLTNLIKYCLYIMILVALAPLIIPLIAMVYLFYKYCVKKYKQYKTSREE